MLTARELDVIAIAEHAIFQLSDNDGKSFEIAADAVSLWLGTISLLAARINAMENGAPYPIADGPAEWCQQVIERNRRAMELIGTL